MPGTAFGRASAVVPETRFGRWFLRTSVWTRYVVELAFDEFAELLPPSLSRPQWVLDAGSGAGVALPLIDRHFAPERIFAVDIDAGEVRRSTGLASGCASEVTLLVGDASRLSLADASIDMIVCHQLLHHARAQEQILREFHRVLVPGGSLLIAESCRSFILSTPVRMFFRHPNEVQRSAVEFQQMVRGAGFEFSAQQVRTSTPFWSLTDWGLLWRLGWRSAPREPTQLTLVATKSS